MAQANTTKNIEIHLNGKPIEIEEGTSLGQLIDDREIERRMIAVEHNTEIVPRHEYDGIILAEGDKLEIVHMVGGG